MQRTGFFGERVTHKASTELTRSNPRHIHLPAAATICPQTLMNGFVRIALLRLNRVALLDRVKLTPGLPLPCFAPCSQNQKVFSGKC